MTSDLFHPDPATSRDQRLQAHALALGCDLSGELQVGGHYAPVVRDGEHLHVSGQIPRVGSTVVVTGAAGAAATLAQAQRAAQVCALRALTLLQRAAGGLDRIGAIPRMGVYVQSAPGFTQQSEVADAASDLLHAVLGPAGVHARTTVGVFQLPKNATVELELLATLAPEPISSDGA